MESKPCYLTLNIGTFQYIIVVAFVFGVKSKQVIAKTRVQELSPCFLLGDLRFKVLRFHLYK